MVDASSSLESLGDIGSEIQVASGRDHSTSHGRDDLFPVDDCTRAWGTYQPAPVSASDEGCLLRSALYCLGRSSTVLRATVVLP